VNNFTLEYSTVGGSNGTTTGFETYGEGSIYFGKFVTAVNSTNGLTGSATVTNCLISGGWSRNFSVVNNGGSLNRLTITGTTFGKNRETGDPAHVNVADSNLAVEAKDGATANVTVTGSTFLGSPGDSANFTAQNLTSMDIVFGGVTATRGTAPGNTLSNSHFDNVVGGGNLTLTSRGTMTFSVRGNTMRDANGSAVTLFKAAADPGKGTPSVSGVFDNNEIGDSATVDSGSKSGNGIFVSAAGTGTMSYTITNNLIHRIHGNGHIYADNTGGSYTANFTIKGNTLDTHGVGWFAGIAITNGAPASTDTINVCADVQTNTLNLASGLGIIVGSSGTNGGHSFNLPGYAGGANLTNVQNFLLANNAGAFITNAYADAPATAAAFTGSGTTCPTP
jgi:hypothetical protein